MNRHRPIQFAVGELLTIDVGQDDQLDVHAEGGQRGTGGLSSPGYTVWLLGFCREPQLRSCPAKGVGSDEAFPESRPRGVSRPSLAERSRFGCQFHGGPCLLKLGEFAAMAAEWAVRSPLPLPARRPQQPPPQRPRHAGLRRALYRMPGQERQRSKPGPRRSRKLRSRSQPSSLLLYPQMVPAGQRRNLPDLVALGLPLIFLQVDKFIDTRPGEYAMAALSPDLAEAEGFDQVDQVGEVNVPHAAAENAQRGKRARRASRRTQASR